MENEEIKETNESTNYNSMILPVAIVVSLVVGGIIGAMFFAEPPTNLVVGNNANNNQNASMDGSGVTNNEFKQKAESYLQENSAALFGQELDFAVNDVNRVSGLIFAVAEASQEGQILGALPIYSSENGEYILLGAQALNMSEQLEIPEQPQQPAQTAPEVPKSEKPSVEVFVMSHCPYGTQMEKAILPVAETLGDKIDFEIKFVDYAMHGEKEIVEQSNQYCIQRDQPDKYMSYLNCFLQAGDTDACLAEAEVDVDAMNVCVAEIDDEYSITANFDDQSSWLNGRYPVFATHKEENEKYGVRGSPTLVVNEVVVSAQRNPAALLNTICSSFETPPDECQASLSSESPSPGFGGGIANTAPAAGCGI